MLNRLHKSEIDEFCSLAKRDAAAFNFVCSTGDPSLTEILEITDVSTALFLRR